MKIVKYHTPLDKNKYNNLFIFKYIHAEGIYMMDDGPRKWTGFYFLKPILEKNKLSLINNHWYIIHILDCENYKLIYDISDKRWYI